VLLYCEELGLIGKERKSNITDPQSAKMATAHGVIQRYNGVAVVDARHQIVVHAKALGEGQENHLLEPMVEATREHFEAIGCRQDVFAKATLAADSGYHSQQDIRRFPRGVRCPLGGPPGGDGLARIRREPALADLGTWFRIHGLLPGGSARGLGHRE